MQSSLDNRKTNLYIVLCCIFLSNAIIAEVIGVKILSLEALFGYPPLDYEITEGIKLNFSLTAGVIIWPVVFVITDIINEYYGKEGVKKISYIAFVIIAYIFVVIWIATQVPPADMWASKNSGFVQIFNTGMNIIVGSLCAFLLSQLLDAYVFHYIRRYTGSNKIWLRATASTLVSQLADSFIVIIIAFRILADDPWPWPLVFSVCISNYIYKFVVAVLLTPLLYLVHFLIDKYLGEKDSVQLQKAAEKQ